VKEHDHVDMVFGSLGINGPLNHFEAGTTRVGLGREPNYVTIDINHELVNASK
jgi:hypothetical protein